MRITKNNQLESKLSREEVRGLAYLAFKQGTLDKSESGILRNLIAMREIIVKEVMTPRTVVYTLRANQTVREVIKPGPPRFSRIPIIGDSPDDVKGMVHRYDLFRMLKEGSLDIAMEKLAQPIHAVPEQAHLRIVLQTFIDRQEQLFLVVDEYGGVSGIITLEDALETLLGVEIIDETDSIKDMQKFALYKFYYRKKD